MSNGILSQEEIDALLKAQDSSSEPEYGEMELDVDGILTDSEKDALGEIGNISMGTAATTLSTLLNSKVEITTPKVTVTTIGRIKKEYPMPYVVVEVQYTQGLRGMNLLVIREYDAAIISDLMMGGDGFSPATELNEIQLSAVGEAMNQMMGSTATSMSEVFRRKIDISPPSVKIVDFSAPATTLSTYDEDELLVRTSFRMVVGNIIDSEIMLLLSIDFAKEMVDNLMNAMMPDNSAGQAKTPPKQQPQQHQQPQMPQQPAYQEPMGYQQPPMQQPPAYGTPQMPPYAAQQMPMGGYGQEYPPNYGMMEMQGQGQPMYGQMPPQHQPMQFGGMHHGSAPVTVQPVQFASLGGGPQVKEASNIDLIMDVPLRVTVELGRTKKLIKEVLELGPGSIVELDKLAGEPVDILVNGKLIAKGEVVVIDENFAVRVTDIVSPMERVTNIQ